MVSCTAAGLAGATLLQRWGRGRGAGADGAFEFRN